MAARAGYRQRGVIQVVAGLALAALLLLIPAAQAAKAPPLAATSQYKAFVGYVKKLDGIAGQARSQAQKDKYEAELTAKRTAAAHKANALFKRASDETKAEYEAQFKEQAEIVRGVEGDDLEAVAAEYAAKLDRATASYRLKLANVAHGLQTFEDRMHERIAGLRGQKSQATDVAQKNAIQEQIAVVIDQITTKRQELAQKRADLKAAFGEQKQLIQAAQAKRETEIAEAAEAKIKQIARHWKVAAANKKATLNTKRESQLGYLEAKLEKGRADIASMPTVG